MWRLLRKKLKSNKLKLKPKRRKLMHLLRSSEEKKIKLKKKMLLPMLKLRNVLSLKLMSNNRNLRLRMIQIMPSHQQRKLLQPCRLLIKKISRLLSLGLIHLEVCLMYLQPVFSYQLVFSRKPLRLIRIRNLRLGIGSLV